ncbi:phage baseplate assembly protein V [Cohnella sp. AR92]|uniref:phage baseplate assembly protein V n=1 Tax=Cohnella sp. AR92 TaxID=648716 RepID=UPI0018642A5C|nr:phage baseplate assembly protein V [Cohnella sp. AR92]
MFDSLNKMNDAMLGLVNGVYIGIVAENKDPENLGRVKLTLPVFDEKTTTGWARVATLMGGKDRGSLFIPEVGDEVVVAFQLGDLRHPIVIGSLWNSKSKPPAGKDEKNNIRKIHTRGGHELVFDDTDGDGKITVKTKKGHSLEMLEKSDTVTIKEANGQNAITIKGGSSNEITVKSGETKITLNNKGDIEISSPKSMTLKSTQVSIEASATMDIKAGAALNIKTDGMLTLKGSMVKIN